jgi:hypothetical protein
MNSGAIPVPFQRNRAIPVPFQRIPVIPVPFLRIPVPFRRIPVDSGGITGFWMESVGHQKVQLESPERNRPERNPRNVFSIVIVNFKCNTNYLIPITVN